jgi:chemotaxis protein histidine kinase CheA
MSDCAEWFEELTSHVDIVLDEDLPALRRMTERSRIERYNNLKANEEELLWEFTDECPEFLTDSERARVRGNFRLARLLIAASFYSEDGQLPPAMDDDFIQAELTAVVEFDRYRQFDALSESQIEQKIRRMEGEVYELVEEYTSTQLSNIEQMLEHPDVQQDLMERLLERYEDRREKIRQGFFIYVETHGLEHMVEAIEGAVDAVNDASAEREEVREILEEELQTVQENHREELVTARKRLEAEIQRVEQKLPDSSTDSDQLASEIAELQEQVTELTEEQGAAASEIDAQIDRTTELTQRLEVQIENLEETKQQAISEATEEVGEKATTLVDNELEELRTEREQIQTELDKLQREREQIEAARDALDEKQKTLEDDVEQIQESVQIDESGIEGTNAVTAQTAKVLEMDYLGRFDITMHETEAIHTDDGPFEVPDGYWDGRSQRYNNQSYLVSILDDDAPTNYPVNETARYEITSTGTLGFGSHTEMVIEASVVSNLDAYAKNGFDAQPATLDSLLAITNDVMSEAEGGEYTYLLGLASPTGWSEKVRNQIEADGLSNTRYSRHVSFCLINLQDGTVLYDDTDEIARENAHLFEPPINAERVKECLETIQSTYVDDVTHESILLRDIVDDHGYSSKVVKRAFNELESDGVGEQLYLEDLGLSLHFGD